MDPLTRGDILELDAYEPVRDAYRERMIAHKKQRRVTVGPRVSVVFEDRETLRYQIQEMTRVERTTDPEKIQIELDVYNELIPGPGELSATLFIEIPELDLIRPELDRLIGIDEHVALVLDGLENDPVVARFDDRQMEEDRISAVHYIRFSLTDVQQQAWRSGARVTLRIDHANYAHETPLDEARRGSLTRDLAGETPVLLDPAQARRARAAESDTLFETATIRARRVGSSPVIVVEAVEPGASLLNAEPALLAELFAAAQQAARALQTGGGVARVRLDLLAADPGQLRFEVHGPK